MNRLASRGQTYYGHGKILLTGEYFVLDGAQSLAIPTSVGQSMLVKYRKNYHPQLYWKSYTNDKNLWFECTMEFWHFTILQTNCEFKAKRLQLILQQARKQNSHFLRDIENDDVIVETSIEFPLNWGLGTSSTLIHCVAMWANIGPYELLANTFLGSGYDVVCAQSMGPILYQLEHGRPSWKMVQFAPLFEDKLYFVHLNKKKDTQKAIGDYKKLPRPSSNLLEQISSISTKMLNVVSIEDFSQLLDKHEEVISTHLGMPTIKETMFNDYPNSMKSLGAWGGDFVLVVGLSDPKLTGDYFRYKGFTTCIPYKELALR